MASTTQHCECCLDTDWCKRCDPCVECNFNVTKEEREAYLESEKPWTALSEEKGWEEPLMKLREIKSNRRRLGEVITPAQVEHLFKQKKISWLWSRFGPITIMKVESFHRLWELVDQKSRDKIREKMDTLFNSSMCGTENLRRRMEIKAIIDGFPTTPSDDGITRV